MNKIVLLFIISFNIHAGFSQNSSLPKIENDTLYTASGFKITVGQEIKLGTGTKDNGDFRYITAARNLLSMPNQRLPSMRSTASGHTVTVKKLKAEGSPKNGYVYYIIIGAGEPISYQCDVENAIAAGELVVPDKYKPKAKNVVVQPISVADELTKLKKLYDDSVITKEEYEAQKKKLLDGN